MNNLNPNTPQGQAKAAFTRQLVAHNNGFKVWLKETDGEKIGRFVAEREADDQGVAWAMFCEIQKCWNAHDSLLAAAKLAVMESANLIGETVLSGPAAEALNEAIKEAGGWTEAEQDQLDALALGENIPEEGGAA
jgi:hypothetical protein